MNENLRLSRKTVGFASICLLLVSSFLIVITSKSYFDKYYENSHPLLFSNIYLEGRKVLGLFRTPSPNEEMIRYFKLHEAEFETLVADYYKIIEQSRAKDIASRNILLKFQMAKLGVSLIYPSGPFFSNSVHGNTPFQSLGVGFFGFDRGGNLSKFSNATKGYIYAPRLNDQISQRAPPISHYVNTGQYFISDGIPDSCKDEQRVLCCGMQVISDNWAVTSCVNSPNL